MPCGTFMTENRFDPIPFRQASGTMIKTDKKIESMERPIRVLHLEDMPLDAKLVAAVLRKADMQCDVKVVDTRLEYETALQEFQPDVIISDHSMPSFNSLEALRILKSSGLKIPFILVTGTLSEKFAAEAIKRGADDYLLKDRLQRLPAAVQWALDKFQYERERKIAEQKIRESEKQYLDLIQHFPAAVYICDAEGNMRLYNQAARELWGIEPEPGKPLWCSPWKVYTDDLRPFPPESCPMVRAINEGRNIAGEEIIIERPDGTTRHVIPHSSPNFNSSGEVTGATNILIDITDRKKAEHEALTLVDRLQSKNKELEQFAYMVSHVIRAPIARILGLASIFGTDPSENKFVIEKIAAETIDLDNVVKDVNIILSARDVDGEQREYVDFGQELDRIRETLTAEIQESGALITTDFSQSQGAVTVRSYLNSIIHNLLSNAIKYRLRGRPLRIHLRFAECGKYICFSVRDNGSGIDMERHGHKIFGLYKRFSSERIPGKGVGLYLVKTYAESLRGKVEIESKVNEGTEVKVYLPADVA